MTAGASGATAAGIAALQAWREGKVALGVPQEELPLERDFEKILHHGLDARGLGNRSAIQRYRPELQAIVEQAVRRPDTDPDTAADADIIDLRVHPGEPDPPGVRFTAWEFDPDAAPPLPTLKVTAPPDGGLRYRWPVDPEPAGATLYRVVSRDDYPPTSPDREGLRAVVTEPEWVDRHPFSTPLRHVQVWVNRGADQPSAYRSQPQLLVQCAVVAIPVDVAIGQDGRQVVGRWSVPEGVDRVEVYRVPLAQANLVRMADPDYRICELDRNLTGFRDLDAPAGRFQYRLYAAVKADGRTQLSAMVSAELEVVGALLPITDLAVRSDPAADSLVDLEWTRPGPIEVRIYRGRQRPAADAGDAALPVVALEQAGLPEPEWLKYRVETDGDRQRMTGVSVSDVSGRVHFTPVSIRGALARVGLTQTHRRLAPVTEARLVQRVAWQLVCFGWPDGATHVHVHLTRQGGQVTDPLHDPVASVDREEWLLRGGIELRGVLPRGPATLHVTPVITGQPTEAGPTTPVNYAGLITLSYRLQTAGGNAQLLRRILRTRTLEVRSDTGGSRRLRFRLVHHPERLPLSSQDGVQVHQRSAQLIKDEWVSLGEFTMPSGGFTRAFIDQPGESVDIAVLDPPLSTLRG
ncbi:MAG TPA: hypothetical protein VLL08_05910 [Kineosporiaceae bacterium]|nr:hypothetical protein [Kineosporiaceae bacterium]